MKMVAYRRKGDKTLHHKLEFDDQKEEQEFFKQTCDNIIQDTRWYLDHLDSCMEYKVSWNDYHKTSKFRSKTA